MCTEKIGLKWSETEWSMSIDLKSIFYLIWFLKILNLIETINKHSTQKHVLY